MAKTKISNPEILAALTARYPNFQGHTAKETAKLFTEAGYEEAKNFQPELISDFFGLMLRTYLQEINISHAKDPLESAGFGEYYDTPYGGYTQRLSVDSVLPVSPAYKGLKDGSGPDPFVVYKPKVAQRFYKQNFDYQSLITIPDDFQLKQIFLSPYGMDEFMSGIMEGLRNGYTLQKYVNKMNALSAYINSTEFALKETQYVTLDFAVNSSGAYSREDLMMLLMNIRNIIEAMVSAPQTGAFNQAGFKSTQDKGRLKLLMRYGVQTEIGMRLLASAYNLDQLNLGIDIIPVPNFGGLIPYNESSFATQLYPAYDNLGHVIGYNTIADQSEATVQEDAVFWKDPNEGVIAILADKGLIFESVQNQYRVEPIRNPRGLYTNYFASSPNNAINVDRYYNAVIFQKAPVI